MAQSSTFQCPVCETLMPRPPDGEKAACPSCGQKIKFRAPAAPAPAAPAGPKMVVVPGRHPRPGRTVEGVETPEEVVETVDEVVEAAPGAADYVMIDDEDDDGSGEGFVFWDAEAEGLHPGEATLNISLEDARALWSADVPPNARPTESVRHDIDFSPTASAALDAVSLVPHTLAKAGELSGGARADFEVGAKIGTGANGVVFAARQASMDRTVAVKLLRPDRAQQANARRKFAAEAVVTGQLDHPNIVPVHELGVTPDGAAFYTMKAVRGRKWSERMAALSESENLDVLLKVCEAVCFAHARGVIHRDLKPANVMVGDHGEVFVMDWGLAVALDDDAPVRAERLADSIARAGTPAYMAPEMARGDAARIGFASDVYLLGALLYECVAGHPPHTGANVYEVLRHAMRGEIRPAERRDELVDIARRAMAVHPGDRHPTARAFRDAVADYRAHRESIRMARTAADLLENSRRTGGYDELSRAVFGFEEALRLWRRNGGAMRGAARARLAYARRARERRDYPLARSLALPLTSAALEQELRAAKPARRAFLSARNALWADAAAEADVLAAHIDADRRRDAARLVVRRALPWAAAAGAVALLALAFTGYRRVAGAQAEKDQALRTAGEMRERAERAQAQAEQDRAAAVKASGEALEAKNAAERERESARLERDAARQELRQAHRAREDAASAAARLAELREAMARDRAGAMDWLPAAPDRADGDDPRPAGASLSAQRLGLTARAAADPADFEAWGRLLAALSVDVREGAEAREAAGAFAALAGRALDAGQEAAARKAAVLAQRFARHAGDSAATAEVEALARRLGGGTGAGLSPGAGPAGDAPREGDPDFGAVERHAVLAGGDRPGFTHQALNPRTAELNQPASPVVDDKGNIYFADRGNFRVAQISSRGALAPVAGNGEAAVSGDGGPALRAGVGRVEALALDGAGGLFLVTADPPAVRRVDLETQRIDAGLQWRSGALPVGSAAADRQGRALSLERRGDKAFPARLADVRECVFGTPRAAAALDADRLAILFVGEPVAVAARPETADGAATPEPEPAATRPRTSRPSRRVRRILEASAAAAAATAAAAVAVDEPEPPRIPYGVALVNWRTGEGAWLFDGEGDAAPGALAVDGEGRLWLAGPEFLHMYDGVRFNDGFLPRRVATYEPDDTEALRALVPVADGGFLYFHAEDGKATALRRLSARTVAEAVGLDGAVEAAQNPLFAETVAAGSAAERRESPNAARFAAPFGDFAGAGDAANLAAYDPVRRRLVVADPAGHKLHTFPFGGYTAEKAAARQADARRAAELHAAIAAANPDYNRKGRFYVEGGKVRIASIARGGLADLRPFAGTDMAVLAVPGNRLASLAGLEGLPLAYLDADDNAIADLAPLRDMPLKTLRVNHNRIADLSPLKGMKLARLHFRRNEVQSVDPLEGMPLVELSLYDNRIRQFRPLMRLRAPRVTIFGATDDEKIDAGNIRDPDLLAHLQENSQRP